MRNIVALVALALSPAIAQTPTFSSGSTGDLGPFTCANQTPPPLQVPASGIFNFTTVSIVNCSISFLPNQRNTPVIILAKEDVVISNSLISVDANGQTPGPGGFFGGGGNQAGFGPGGGAIGQPGQWVGPLSLVPLIGGSGGGGQTGGTGVGSGGGGAIVIASSTSIQCSGSVFARGGSPSVNAAYGSGGAIRLVATSFSGGCQLRATAASGSNHGIVRIEAQPGQLLYTGSSIPPAVLAPINPEIIPTSTTAGLTIASIGGFPVLSDLGSRPGLVDVVLPRGLTDPLPVVVQGRNIPIGTQVNLNLSGSSSATYTPGTLDGSFDQSLATLQIAGLNRDAESHLFVFATFDVPASTGADNPDGPDQVAKVRIEAAPGKESSLAFLRRDGSVIDPTRVPPALRRHFGYRPR